MITNFTLHSYVTLQYYDAIFPEKYVTLHIYILEKCLTYNFIRNEYSR
jgi:hypothetical protein